MNMLDRFWNTQAWIDRNGKWNQIDNTYLGIRGEFFRREPDEAILVKVNAERVDARDQDVDAEVKLNGMKYNVEWYIITRSAPCNLEWGTG